MSCFVGVSLLKFAVPTAPNVSLKVIPPRELLLWNRTQWVRAVENMVGIHVFVHTALMPFEVGFQRKGRIAVFATISPTVLAVEMHAKGWSVGVRLQMNFKGTYFSCPCVSCIIWHTSHWRLETAFAFSDGVMIRGDTTSRGESGGACSTSLDESIERSLSGGEVVYSVGEAEDDPFAAFNEEAVWSD
jgi:hypothetical protein